MEAVTWPRELQGPQAHSAMARKMSLIDFTEVLCFCAFTPHTQEKESGRDKDFFILFLPISRRRLVGAWLYPKPGQLRLDRPWRSAGHRAKRPRSKSRR